MNRLMALVNTESAVHPSVELSHFLLKDTGGTIDLVTANREAPRLFQALRSSQLEALDQELRMEKQTQLAELAEKIRTGNIAVDTHLLQGKPFIEIIHLAESNKVDLVVSDHTLDRHEDDSPGQSETNFKLLRKCPCPVWLIGPGESVVPRKIAAAIDVQDSDDENLALNASIMSRAADLCGSLGAQLDVVQAWDLAGESAIVRSRGLQLADQMREEYCATLEKEVEKQLEHVRASGIQPHVKLLHGDPSRVIPSYVQGEHIDLIIMGTVGRGGIPGLLMGNTAERVVRRVSCSILALKPRGFVTPV